MNAETQVTTPAPEVMGKPRETPARPKGKGGFQRRIDRAVRRLYLYQELVAKLEARIKTQDEIILAQAELIGSLQAKEAM